MIQKENMYGHLKRQKFILREIQQTAKDPHSIQIFDFGCGTGEMITIPVGAQGYNIVGFDYHAESIEKAKKINNYNNVTFICGDFEDCEIPGSFDVIICAEVLEHVPNPGKILLKLKNMLKDNGVLLVTIPNGYGPFELENYLYTIIGERRIMKIKQRLFYQDQPVTSVENGSNNTVSMTENVECGHIQFFTMNSFLKMVTGCGLSVQKIENSSFICGPFSGFFLKHNKKVIDINVNKITRYLPRVFCSGWYFVLTKDNQNK